MLRGHPYAPKSSFDGGDLDCGNGLLLLIRKHIDPLERGDLLEIRSTEISVPEDLPAWCRLTGNELVSHIQEGRQHSFLVAKGPFDASRAQPASKARQMPSRQPVVAVSIPTTLPRPKDAPAVKPLSVMGIGSWPRPAWLLDALHRRLEGRLDEAQFEAAADDAVRLSVDAQLRAGVDVITDGEQRRDNYASFVGGILDNCQLIPIVDLLPYVDDPAEFERELRALDVPAEKVRHPAVFGPLGRSRPIALTESRFLATLSDKPRKVALPGPYLLTRTMWMECITDRAYADRKQLARDVVRVLREELADLLADGVSLVQFDEPVLSEVVFGHARENRTFMCGALGEKLETPAELAFAEELLAELADGFPRDRLALHVCRGNWSPDESVALHGDYAPLLPLLSRAPVGTLFLEMCTERAGDARLLAQLPRDKRIGIGAINQKRTEIETPESICAHIEPLVQLLGAHRVLLNPDCGFATFADNPLASAAIATQKLAALSQAAAMLRARHGVG